MINKIKIIKKGKVKYLIITKPNHILNKPKWKTIWKTQQNYIKYILTNIINWTKIKQNPLKLNKLNQNSLIY